MYPPRKLIYPTKRQQKNMIDSISAGNSSTGCVIRNPCSDISHPFPSNWHLDVSKNRGIWPPKWMVYDGKPYFCYGWFRGFPIFLERPISCHFLSFQVTPWNFIAFGLVFVALTLAAAIKRLARPTFTTKSPPEGPGVVELLADLRNAWKQETWAKDQDEIFRQVFVCWKKLIKFDSIWILFEA